VQYSKRLWYVLICLAGAMAPLGAVAQQAGERLTLHPAPGLSSITLYKAESGAALRKVPAKALEGTFVVLQASGTGWLKLKVGSDVAWVDSYDVEVERATGSCTTVGLTNVPQQNRTGLAQRCGK
jgi:hypothetical protein